MIHPDLIVSIVAFTLSAMAFIRTFAKPREVRIYTNSTIQAAHAQGHAKCRVCHNTVAAYTASADGTVVCKNCKDTK